MKSLKTLVAVASFGLLLTNANAQSFLTNGLVAYYPFNGNANDASGNGNNGTIVGATLVTNRFGQANSAFKFIAANNSVVATSFMPPTGTSARTFSIWFNTTNATSGSLFSYGGYPLFSRVELEVDSLILTPKLYQIFERNTSYYSLGTCL
jgi:hypothetical protein